MGYLMMYALSTRARQCDRVVRLFRMVMRPPEPVANERAGRRRAHAASWTPRLRPRWRLDARWIIDTPWREGMPRLIWRVPGWPTATLRTRSRGSVGSCPVPCGRPRMSSRSPVPKDAPSTRPRWSECLTPRAASTSRRGSSNTSVAASRDPPPIGPGLIRPGRGTAPASTGPRRATPPSPLSCAARPRRSSSLPSTAPSDGPGR